MKLTDNFQLEEFASPDADYFPISVLNNIEILSLDLQILRDQIGQPIHINSGWRTEKHNREVGGVFNSQHLKGKAADLRVVGMPPMDLYDLIDAMREEGRLRIGGMGLYDTFVHYDIRGFWATWDQRRDKTTSKPMK